MNRRKFQPTGIDALEERLAMTAFAVPFTLVSTQPSNEVNPKFLVLTKRVESQINNAISDSFARFAKSVNAAQDAYLFDLARSDADSSGPLGTLDAKVGKALSRLASDLDKIAHKVPYGGENLFPILQARVFGSAGVTDTTTGVNAPSLQTKLNSTITAGDKAALAEAIQSTQTFVRADVKNYINLGVTNGYFTLGKGATLPKIS